MWNGTTYAIQKYEDVERDRNVKLRIHKVIDDEGQLALELVKEFVVMTGNLHLKKRWLYASFKVIDECIYFFQVEDKYSDTQIE